jgi:glutamine synthetase
MVLASRKFRYVTLVRCEPPTITSSYVMCGASHGSMAGWPVSRPSPFSTVSAAVAMSTSLWDMQTGANLLFDTTDLTGSVHWAARSGRPAQASLVALTCPSFNSYRRLQPHAWSSALLPGASTTGRLPFAWRLLLRARAVVQYRIKTVDTANPTALGSIIAAMLDESTRTEPGTSATPIQQICPKRSANVVASGGFHLHG